MPRMATTEQSGEPRRDYASPATWGDVESVRHEVADLRADVARVESSLSADISRVESGLHAEIARVESKFDTGLAEVRMEMARMEMRLIRWTVATMLAGVAAIGVLYGILEAVR